MLGDVADSGLSADAVEIGAAAAPGTSAPCPAGASAAHPARPAPSASASASPNPGRGASLAALECAASERVDMWVIYLEAAGILVLVLALVWWTMRGKK